MDSLQPRSLIVAYLEALSAGDCELAGAFAAPTLVTGNGALCGAVRVRAYRLSGAPKAVGQNDWIYAVELTTDGSSDGSIPAGEILWFYDLARQPSGGWRVASGGSGP